MYFKMRKNERKMTTQKFSLIFRFVGDLFTFRVLSHTILAGLYCQLVDLEWLYTV